MPNISLNSPNTLNYSVGKGIVSLKFTDAAPDADYVDIGDVSEFELTPTITKLDHFSSRTGVKSKDRTIVIESGLTLRMVMSEFTARNMGLVLLGTPEIAANVATIDILSEDVRSCAVRFRATNDAGPRWDFDLPNVQFAPTKAIAVISTADGWDTLEATGDAVKDGDPLTYGYATCTFVDALPVVAAAPEISGVAQVDEVLTIFPGTWSGDPTFTFVWKKAGTPIVGATHITYVPVVGDIGAVITCTVSATNGGGTATATSAATAAVIAA